MKAFFKVTAKMMLPGVVSGAILSWITLINELSSSVMLYTSRTRTMSVAIYNEVIRASYGTAAALATILTCTDGHFAARLLQDQRQQRRYDVMRIKGQGHERAEEANALSR